VDGHAWETILTGQGEDVILWLVGGLRAADAAFRSIPILADAFRIVAPTYPPLDSMDAMAAGLAGLLDAQGIEKAHVLAGSFGGMIAQVFARRHGEKVDKLILSTTAAPNSQAADRYKQELTLFSPLPEAVIRQGAKQRFYDIVAPPEDEGGFWKAYFEELFGHRLGKADLLSTYHCLIDYMRNKTFTPDDLRDWGQRVLILDSDNDTTFGEEAREAMHDLYPAAKTHTFTGAGHSPGSNQRDLYFQIVRDFLNL
jgi:3-oxoadipate enol-lactonase